MPCLYSLNDDEYEGYGHCKGEKAKTEKSLPCPFNVSQPLGRQGEGFALAEQQ